MDTIRLAVFDVDETILSIKGLFNFAEYFFCDRDGATARYEHLILTWPDSALVPQAREALDRMRVAPDKAAQVAGPQVVLAGLRGWAHTKAALVALRFFQALVVAAHGEPF